MGMFLALFLLLVPLSSEKFDKFTRLARAMKEDRATFVMVGTGTTLTFLLAYVKSNTLNTPNAELCEALSAQFRLGHKLVARTQRTTPMPRSLVTTLPMDCRVGVRPRRQAPCFSGLLPVSFAQLTKLLLLRCFGKVSGLDR